MVAAIPPRDAVIRPTTATFDKNVAYQADIAVSMTLNGNTLNAISDGSKDLAAGNEYSMSGDTITIHKSYLAGQSVGALRLTFDFSAGTDPVLTVTVSDTTPVEESYTLNIAAAILTEHDSARKNRCRYRPRGLGKSCSCSCA